MATKVIVNCKIGSSDVRIEGEMQQFSQLGLLSILSAVEELTVDRCGLCNETSLRARVRKHGEYVFPELVCRSCGGSLQFGQRKDGSGLFPKEWAPPYGGGHSDDGEGHAPADDSGW